MPTIGVISDTHGLLRDEALVALTGSDLILHAGDVGDGDILDRLAEIAPVRAVRGNTDRGALAARLPGTEVVGLSGNDEGPLVYLLHELELLDLDPRAAGISAVVYGHTHSPAIETRDEVLYFNPGAAGQPFPTPRDGRKDFRHGGRLHRARDRASGRGGQRTVTEWYSMPSRALVCKERMDAG